MTTAIFYDLSKITDLDVDRMMALAGANAVHVHSDDTFWNAADSVARRSLPSMRNHVARARTLQQIWEWLAEFTDTHYRGIDLRDVTRYNLLFALERTYYPAWVLSLLRDEFSGGIDWYTDCGETIEALRTFDKQAECICRVRPTQRPRPWGIVRNWREAVRTCAWMLLREWQERRWTQTSLPVEASGPIVFTEYYPNSTRVSLAIAQYLRRKSRMQSVFVSKRLEVVRVAQAAEMPATLLRPFPRTGDWKARHRSLRTSWKLQLARLGEKPIQMVPGGPDCRSIILPALKKEVMRAFSEAIGFADDAHAMIDKLAPACVATTTSGSTFGRTMAAVASARGIPTAWMQHGLSTDDVTFLHMSYDALLVWGEYDRRRFRQADVQGTVHVVGAPHYDSLAKHARELPHDPTPLKDRPGVNVLYLASRTGGAVVTTAAAERLILELTSAVRKIPNAVLTIKTHPGDRTKLAERLVAHLDRVYVVEHGSSLEMILKCDVAVVTSSTAGLEACVAQKPLISFTYEGMHAGVDYAGYVAAICVTNERELSTALNQIWNADGMEHLLMGQRRLVDDMLNGATGNATSRSAEVLSLLAEHRSAHEVPGYGNARL